MRKYRYGSSYSSSKPKNWRNTLLLILLGIPFAVIFLEIGLKNFAPPAWLGTKANTNTQIYELKLTSNNKALTSVLSDTVNSANNSVNGDLQVKNSEITSYDLVPNQSTKFWQINAQGFRLDKPVAIEKDPQTIRIFVVGNSTAFGTLAANNQATIAPQLEQLLNNRLRDQAEKPQAFQPAILPYYADQVEKVKLLPPRIRLGKYQVITAAVPGYTSTNELSLLVHKISEFKPDCLIFLNGYEDLRSPSTKPARALINLEDILQKLEQKERVNNQQKFQNWLNSFYIARVYQHLFTPPNSQPNSEPTTSGYYQVFNANQLSNDPQELKLRVANYDGNLRKLINLNFKIPVIIALQPEITGKANPTSAEIKILKSLGSDYGDRITKSYKALETSVLGRSGGNIRVVSLYSAFNIQNNQNIQNSQIFLDPIHLTEAGNQLVAKKLFNLLEDTFKLQSQPAPERS
jgi:hypothetical protein